MIATYEFSETVGFRNDFDIWYVYTALRTSGDTSP